jgi:hypothetical protein
VTYICIVIIVIWLASHSCDNERPLDLPRDEGEAIALADRMYRDMERHE